MDLQEVLENLPDEVREAIGDNTVVMTDEVVRVGEMIVGRAPERIEAAVKHVFGEDRVSAVYLPVMEPVQMQLHNEGKGLAMAPGTGFLVEIEGGAVIAFGSDGVTTYLYEVPHQVRDIDEEEATYPWE